MAARPKDQSRSAEMLHLVSGRQQSLLGEVHFVLLASLLDPGRQASGREDGLRIGGITRPFPDAVLDRSQLAGSRLAAAVDLLAMTIHFFCSTIRSSPRWIIEAMATRMTSFSPPRR